MDLRITSTPLTQAKKLEVVTLAQAKAQCRVTHSFEDDLISSYVETAYDFLDGRNGWLGGCCLLQQDFEWRLYNLERNRFGQFWAFDWGGDRYSCQPGRGIEFPLRPLDLESVTITTQADQDGTFASYAGMPVVVLEEGSFSRLVTKFAGLNAVKISFTAGYGTTAADIPSPIRQAIKMLVADLYAQRESQTMQPSEKSLFGLKALAGRYRLEPDHS